MNILLKKVQVIDPTSAHHLKVVDIELKNGKINQIGRNLTSTFRSKELKGHLISPGWLDIGTHIGEPGFEHRETIESVSKAARAGGYTALAPFPNTSPCVDNKAQVAYLKNRAGDTGIHLYPIGAISRDARGEDLAELYDMKQSGAVAFSDGLHSVQTSGVMLRALEYVKAFHGLIIDQSTDLRLSPGAEVHESKLSTSLGLKGQPSLAEAIQIRKHIDLVSYTESRMLFHLLTSKEGLDEIKKGKKSGLTIGASVSPMHLCFDEKLIEHFDVYAKLSPPLRSKSDRKALLKGLNKGHIDIISSMHTPLDPEEKVMAFHDATPGAISLQLVYPLLRTHLSDQIDVTTLVQALCHHPRTWLGIPIPSIKTGEMAEMTIFHPDEKWTFSRADNESKSNNTIFFDQEFTGKITGTISKSRIWLD